MPPLARPRFQQSSTSIRISNCRRLKSSTWPYNGYRLAHSPRRELYRLTRPQVARFRRSKPASADLHHLCREQQQHHQRASAKQATYTLPFYGSLSTQTNNGRPNAQFTSMTDIFSGVNSNYNAFVVQANHSASRDLTFQASYTWSHALDYGVNDTTFTSTNALLDPHNLRAEYGNSSHNVPNRVIATAIATSPWRARGLLGYLTNDYSLAPSFSWQSGAPYSAGISGSVPSSVTVTGPAGAETLVPVSTGGLNGSGGASRLVGTSRNQYKLDDEYILDLSGSKTLVYRDAYRLEFRASVYNLFNHQNITSANSSATQ